MIGNHGTGSDGLHLKGILLEQRKDSIWRLDRRIVDDEIFNLVFENEAAHRVELIIGDSVHMQRPPQQYLGYKHCMPRDANGAPTLIVNHAKLNGGAEPKVDKCFEKRKGTLVLVYAV